MPARTARSNIQGAIPKNSRNKNHKRNLDAYAIASHSTLDKSRVRNHRLGEFLDSEPEHKRRKVIESEDDEGGRAEDVPSRRTSMRRRTAGQNEDGIEEGSDSSGNEWTLGGLAENDDDSELDSDEAFGESDEERFDGFAFRGSSSSKTPRRKRKMKQQVNGEIVSDEDGGIDLDETDQEGEDDFGDEGVDLAAMLDDYDASQGKEGRRESGDESPSEDEDDREMELSEQSEQNEDEDEDEDEDEEDEYEADEERVARLRDRLSVLDGDQQAAQPTAPQHGGALSVEDLLADLDPSAKKQYVAGMKTRKRSEAPKTLTVPLPKRQQDRLDREMASKQAKEQLDRWRDTVIHNRRAEFLTFPLPDPDRAEPVGKEKFIIDDQPRNELEDNIRKIMVESGMVPKPGQVAEGDVDEVILKSEELATKKMSIEEVMRRRAELRKARELLFQEEIKAKRIAKIKSKSYRRVHRKEKERAAQREQAQLEVGGVGQGIDDDAKEQADRKRAEARMSTKHRDSKWAKSLRATNRTAWDDDARDSIHEQARRQEELKRRIAGENVDVGDENDSNTNWNEDSDDSYEEDAATLKRLDRLKSSGNSARESRGVGSMKFMRAADEKQRKENEEDIERVRKELAIQDGDEEESESETQGEGLGRAIFGPQVRGQKEASKRVKRDEMEEGNISGDEDETKGALETVPEKNTPKWSSKTAPRHRDVAKGKKVSSNTVDGWLDDDRQNLERKSGAAIAEGQSTWLTHAAKPSKDHQRTRVTDDAGTIAMNVTASPRETAGHTKEPKIIQQPLDVEVGNTDGWMTVTHRDSDDESPSDPEQEESTLTHQQRQQRRASLHRRAFAGDDVQLAFNAEKAIATQEEGQQNEDNGVQTLPGWGSWTGVGLSKSIRRANYSRQRNPHHPLFKNKQPPNGVKPSDRQDKGLPNVIISEKQHERKGGTKKYLAPILPHGFETRDQYERSLRLPVGPEWTTKEVFQRGTRPRVVVGRGRVVEAMERPLV